MLSLIIPVFNSKIYINRLIESIKGNSSSIGEVIIINDGGSIEDFNFILLSIKDIFSNTFGFSYNENKGPWFARNYGIEKSNYDYVSFHDPDDILPINSIEYRFNLFSKDSKARFICSSYKWLHKKNGYGVNFVLTHFNKFHLLQTCFVTTPSVITKKKYLYEAGLFENIHAEDYHLWLKLLNTKNSYAIGDNKTFVLISKSSGSLSSNKLKSSLWHYNILRKFVDNFLLRLIFYFMYFINTVCRRFFNFKLKPLIIPPKYLTFKNRHE
jgi:teichuronic acid biosynthesis glycosyltransferase TuaG